jgi:outer membrane immunogenic protein
MNGFLKALALLAMITPAAAADIYGGMKDKPAGGGLYQEETPTFAGVYIGGSVNWNFLNVDQNVGFAEDCESCYIRGVVDNMNEFASVTNLDDTSDAFGAGVQTGYNFQIGRIYGGPRISFDYLGAEAGFSHTEDGTTAKLGADVEWLLSAGGKLGVAVHERVGVYAHLNWVHANVGMSGSLREDDNVVGSISSDKTVNGVSYGGGVDIVLAPNWQLFVEYTHVDLDDVKLSGIVNAGDVDCITYDYKGSLDLDLVKVGLNYRF